MIFAEFESEEGLVEDGVLSSCISFSRLMFFRLLTFTRCRCPGELYYPSGLILDGSILLWQVFQEVSTYCSVLKSLDCEIVQSKYSDALSVLNFEEENQEGLYWQVSANVQALLDDSLFLQDGHNENMDPNFFLQWLD